MISNIFNSYSERENIDKIEDAFKNKIINKEASDYLKKIYSNSNIIFRSIFEMLGKCLGAPKTRVSKYDNVNWKIINEFVNISDISPFSSYIVHHKLEKDPLRNQFFTLKGSYNVDISVSSIISIVIGRQKLIDRSIEKITTKYYDSYINQVLQTTSETINQTNINFDKENLLKKINSKFKKEYITDTSEMLLSLIEKGQEKLFITLLRNLDNIPKPHLNLRDVWRVTCLFDLIPQIRIFIKKIQDMYPKKIISIKDTFYNINHSRNYRDAKIILNLGDEENIIPLEILCQVRTFFEYQLLTHDIYKESRNLDSLIEQKNKEKHIYKYFTNGIYEYNKIVFNCINILFDRIGWNILYNKQNDLFDGFPKNLDLHYTKDILNSITDKVNKSIKNNLFNIKTSPIKLTQNQENEIFNWMTKFALASLMPYKDKKIIINKTDNIGEKLCKFILKELQIYYK